MANLDEKRTRFRAQIAELHRLADEAISCAQLLRQQAQSHEALLADKNLTEKQLDELLAEKPDPPFHPHGGFVVTEGLM